MISEIYSCSVLGIDGFMVQVEADISKGLPSYALVGLPDTAVKESKERVFSSIKNNGFKYPMKRITINLAPADIKKEGPWYDLPIAMGILTASEEISPEIDLNKTIFIGELSLKGEIRPVRGILPMILEAKAKGFSSAVIPWENAREASLVEGIKIHPAKNLMQTIEHVCGMREIETYSSNLAELLENNTDFSFDFSDVKGQNHVKRAMEVAAAGYHNIIMIGPPGSGKTMLARRFPSVLPPLSPEEALEATKIYSISGMLKGRSLITERPFRSPHHTISKISLIGGGQVPKPGEVSLAHLGVLFLDEMPEFQKSALEVLRQPMEDKFVNISRVNATLTYPASFLLVSSINPCPCGYYGDETHNCQCTPRQIKNYLNKISGPLLDRIDIHIEVKRTAYEDLENDAEEESSLSIKERVNRARDIQLDRYKNENIFFNSQLGASQIKKYCSMDKEAKSLVKDAFEAMNLSARAYHRIIKLARTIADLDGREGIDGRHIGEAIQYRSLDRKYWEVF
ncbi:YifB family Mg chelatase-like AAA ATPase [Alkalibacter saccharofermentans]|uniref:Magnesium chelatase family protein n=1 Tax=Alkalibacter saccharofermentans DSM 14828 TaxID=1120975 RepID=A0A1M4S5Z8_9FIRM|nr:YifB family Mg chelatase-like AAA ATPase [Alkalibacter saccharofermentans]SHE27633.1 magnesium chelatase family protein [Alkalibacter saccharofermentans DSM 14828]